MQRSHTGLLAIGAFVIGCGASAVGPLLIPAARAGAPTTRWEYFCQDDIESPWQAAGREQLNRIGREGWELTQQLVGMNGVNGDVYCFKRPLN